METEAWKELDNAVFPSKEEEDMIEHVDLSYSEFFLLVQRIEREAYNRGLAAFPLKEPPNPELNV